MEKTISKLLRERRESLGLSINELAKLLNVSAFNYGCMEAAEEKIELTLEEPLRTTLNISEVEWAEAKRATLELKEFLHYQKAFIQLGYRSKGTDAIKCLTAEEYEVIKRVFPKEVISDILGQLNTLDNITTIIDKNR